MTSALPGLPDGLIDDASTAALDALARRKCAAPLVIIRAPAGDVGPVAGAAFGRACLASEDARTADLRVCYPESDRWSVEEVDARIIGPTRLQPLERNVIVVASAAAMDARTAEHLLKTIEEPSAPSLFVFVVSSATELLKTIVGRAGAIVQVRLAAPEVRAAALAAKGADPQVAKEAVELAGPLTSLAELASTPGDKGANALEALRAIAAAPLFGTTRTARAAEIVAACEALAPSGSASKSVVRGLCRQAIERWRRLVASELHAVATAAEFCRLRAALEALDAAEADLRAYTSPLVVLTSLFAAL